jgi:2,4-dienoyl-CoA reductase-like NADH-dependent reductase (Old Yellow Enzyme family)
MTDLFAPLSFRCGATSRNRVALAALTNTQSHDDGTLGDDELAWLDRRAQGGFGLIATCAAFVSPDGKGFDGQLGVAGEQHLEGLERVASALSRHGSLSLVQLYHGGARAPRRLTGQRPWSAVASADDPETHPDAAREGTDEEVSSVIEAFVRGAQLSQRAGFSGVEVHAAHGYLLGQFLSKHNQRKGPWGGSLAARASLVRAIVTGVRERCGEGFLLGVRLSPEDFGYASGMDIDESIQCAQWFSEDGADFVHLSLWDHHKPCAKHPTQDTIALFRAALPPAVRILAAGKIWSREDAHSVLSRGADMVALGRAAILDPDWPTHARSPEFSPVRGPLSPAELHARAVSPRFVEYLRRFSNIVTAGDGA